MSTSVRNLYEVLGLDKKASPEEVRRAYRRRALETHPDRLPPTTSPSAKASAAEQFRLVNNAYEVLNDPDSRQLYDEHGAWPPPTQDRERHAQPQDPSSFDFFTNPFSGFGGFPSHQHPRRSRDPFGFSDPFDIFNEIFGEHFASGFHNDPFPRGAGAGMGDFHDPFFGMATGGPFGGGLFSQFPGFGGAHMESRSMSHTSLGQNGRWVSQSQMTRSINGRTETVLTRVDAEGNKHVTYSSPDGERYTINGIEQPNHSSRGIQDRPSASSRSAPAPAIEEGTRPSAYRRAHPPSLHADTKPSRSFSVPVTGPPAHTQPYMRDPPATNRDMHHDRDDPRRRPRSHRQSHDSHESSARASHRESHERPREHEHERRHGGAREHERQQSGTWRGWFDSILHPFRGHHEEKEHEEPEAARK